MSAGPYHVEPASHASMRTPSAPSQNTTCCPSGATAALGADWSICPLLHVVDRSSGVDQPLEYTACQRWPPAPRQYTVCCPLTENSALGAEVSGARPCQAAVRSLGPYHEPAVDHASRRWPLAACQKTIC